MFTDIYTEAATLLEMVTGWPFSGVELRRVGERVCTLRKLFNIREGWKPEDDWLPQRLLSEPLPSGVARGASLTPPELREMIQGYYRAREWDEDGFIPEKKLTELGIPALTSALLKAERKSPAHEREKGDNSNY